MATNFFTTSTFEYQIQNQAELDEFIKNTVTETAQIIEESDEPTITNYKTFFHLVPQLYERFGPLKFIYEGSYHTTVTIIHSLTNNINEAIILKLDE